MLVKFYYSDKRCRDCFIVVVWAQGSVYCVNPILNGQNKSTLKIFDCLSVTGTNWWFSALPTSCIESVQKPQGSFLLPPTLTSDLKVPYYSCFQIFIFIQYLKTFKNFEVADQCKQQISSKQIRNKIWREFWGLRFMVTSDCSTADSLRGSLTQPPSFKEHKIQRFCTDNHYGCSLLPDIQRARRTKTCHEKIHWDFFNGQECQRSAFKTCLYVKEWGHESVKLEVWLNKNPCIPQRLCLRLSVSSVCAVPFTWCLGQESRITCSGSRRVWDSKCVHACVCWRGHQER